MIFCKCKLHTTRSGVMQILKIQHRFFLMSWSRLDLHQALLANSFRKRRELQFFSTRNAIITILFSRVILPVKVNRFSKRLYYHLASSTPVTS